MLQPSLAREFMSSFSSFCTGKSVLMTQSDCVLACSGIVMRRSAKMLSYMWW